METLWTEKPLWQVLNENVAFVEKHWTGKPLW